MDTNEHLENSNTEVNQLPENASMNELKQYLKEHLENPQQMSGFPEGSKQPQHFADYNFSGGLNVDSTAEHLKQSELRQADDLIVTERGGIKKRQGVSTYQSTSYDNITQLIKWPRKSGSKQLLGVVLDGTQYKLYSFTTDTEIQNIDNSEIGYFIFQDEFYFIDGSNYYKYNGTSVFTLSGPNYFMFIESQIGSFQIGETITKDRIYGSSLSGTFSRYEEITGASSGATAKVISFDSSVNKLFIYDKTGTFSDGETINGEGSNSMTIDSEVVNSYTLKASFSENNRTILGVNRSSSSDSYSYTTSGDNWIAGEISGSFANFSNIEDDYSNNLTAVEKCKYAVRHTNSFRFFFAGNADDKTALYYSEPNQPDFIRATSILYPSEAEGPIIGLNEMMGHLIVSYENGDWIYRGVDPAQDAEWKKIPTRHGAHNKNVINLTDNSLTTYADNGIYVKNPSILGQDDNMIPGENFIVNIAKNKVENILQSVTNPDIATAAYDPDEDIYYLAFCDDGSSTNNKVLVYNWKLKAFTQWTGLSINDFLYYDSGALLAAQGSDVIKIGGGDYTGTYTFRTKKYFLKAPFKKKQINKIYISLENPRINDYSVDVTLIIDNTVVKRETINIPNPGPETFIASINVRNVGSRVQVKVEG